MINLIDKIQESSAGRDVYCLKLNSDETAVAFFTEEVEHENVHFCEEDEIRGYHKCPGENCLLCQIGKKPTGKYLIPVYSFPNRSVMTLPVSDKMTPRSLLPQIFNILNSHRNREDGWKTPFFIKRDSYVYTVTKGSPPEDTDEMIAVIKDFHENYQVGDLGKAAHQRMPKHKLLFCPQIREKAKLKGIPVDDIDHESPLKIVGSGNQSDTDLNPESTSAEPQDMQPKDPCLSGFQY